MGLEKKVAALLALNPNVAVLPECSDKSAMHSGNADSKLRSLQ